MASELATGLVGVGQERYWEAYWADRSNYESKNSLVEMNFGLVGFMIERLRLERLSAELLDDAKQEGRIALITAVEKYDQKFGYKFSTYAVFWIRQAIY